MTPRKEIFIAVKTQLQSIPQIELVDLDRGQFDAPSDNYPDLFTAALITVAAINYTCMTEQRQEGTATIEVKLYTQDGWMDQHQNTADPTHGLTEIDLLDSMAQALQHHAGNSFTPLQLQREAQVPDEPGRLVFIQTYTCNIYRTINPKYTTQHINLTPQINVVP